MKKALILFLFLFASIGLKAQDLPALPRVITGQLAGDSLGALRNGTKNDTLKLWSGFLFKDGTYLNSASLDVDSSVFATQNYVRNYADSVAALSGADSAIFATKRMVDSAIVANEPTYPDSSVLFTGSDGLPTTDPSLIYSNSSKTLRISAANPFITLRSELSGFSGLNFMQSTFNEGHIRHYAVSAEMRFNTGRYPGWGGKYQFYVDTINRMNLTSSQFTIKVPSSVFQDSTPIINFTTLKPTTSNGLEWKQGANLDGHIKMLPSNADITYSAGRVSAWGGEHIFLADQAQVLRLAETLVTIGKNTILTGNLAITGSVRDESDTLRVGGDDVLEFQTQVGSTWTSHLRLNKQGKFGVGISTTAYSDLDAGSGRFSGGLVVENTRGIHQIYYMGNSITSNGGYISRINTILGSSWSGNNLGISGNTTTSMLARFDEVTKSGDAEYVVILGGINDIANNVPYSTITGNLQAMYTAAKAKGITVVAVTVTPFEGNASWSAARQARLDSVNAWILAIPTDVDYTVDAYTYLEDPSNPDALLPAYNSGDGLHLNATGQSALGDIIHSTTTWTPVSADISLTVNGTASITQTPQSTSSTDSILVKDGTTGQVKAIARDLSDTITMDFPSISANSTGDLTHTVTGAAVTDPVSVGYDSGLHGANITITAFVSSANTVTVRVANISGISVDPSPALIKIKVLK